MTKSLTIFENSSKVDNRPWQIYLILGIFANAAIWGTALLFLKLQQPTYTSTLSATLPGSGSGGNVTLPNIGQASYESSSPYANSSIQDPRETYKAIAGGELVRRAAAKQLNISLQSFGQPRIKLSPNTTIITFELKAASPEEARNKSLALYQAFQARLNLLRVQESVQREAGFQSGLSSSREKLEIAQKRLSEYKAYSGLNSNAQLTALLNNIEQLRRQRAEIIAQQQQATTHFREISATVNLSPQQAADAFVLQTDQIFQQNLKNFSEASTDKVVFSSKFLPNHPAVVAQKAKEDAAQIALLNRSQFLLGRPVSPATLKQLNLTITNNGSAREALFKQLIAVQAEERGLKSQAQETNKQISHLEGRLKTLAQQESTLDALKRNLQVAEAVFSSTLTRLDIGRSNAFGSYPLIQILSEPSLPQTPSSPNQELVFLGAALGSLFLTTGLVSLGLRKRKSWIPEQEREFKTPEYQTKDLGFPQRDVGSHS